MRNCLLFWAVILAPVSFQGQGTISLLENSPFLPPAKVDGGEGEDGDSPLALLQLRGITSLEGEYIFSIFDPSTRRSKWMRQGVPEDGLTITDYDSVGNTVTLYSPSADLSRQLELSEINAPTPSSGSPAGGTAARTIPSSALPVPRDTSSAAAARSSRTVDTSRPSRRNLEILRERREALANQLRQQSNSGSAQPSNNSQRPQERQSDRPSNGSRR